MSSDNSRFSAQQLEQMMQASPAFQALGHAQRSEMSDSMAKVFNYINNNDKAPARQLAPNFDRLRNQGDQPYPDPGSQPVPPPANTSDGTANAGANGDGSAIGRSSGATADMLGAINFPDFVASLVQGTFQAIVDASIQQMEAYSNLLAETAKTVDSFMTDNITDDMAKDHLADNYGDIFMRDLRAPQPELAVTPQTSAQPPELPSFLSNLGFDSVLDIDQQAVEEVIIPEARHSLAEMRHQTLGTMVMMGINRIVVDDGEIKAKLVFNVDAKETMNFTFDESKPTNWNLAGTIGRSSFGANGIMVTTTNINTQSDLNVRAELTGEVKIRFRSETFPLERFADSAAIQLINTRATVPQPRVVAETDSDVIEGEVANAATEQSTSHSRDVELAGASSTSDPWLPTRK